MDISSATGMDNGREGPSDERNGHGTMGRRYMAIAFPTCTFEIASPLTNREIFMQPMRPYTYNPHRTPAIQTPRP
jgi:hypothetical protein